MTKKKSILSQFLLFLWSLFLNGFLFILPVTLTIALFHFTFKAVIKWLAPLNKLIGPTSFGTIPFSELFLAIGLILLLGALLKIFVLRRLIHFLESVIFKIPLVRPVYAGIKQLVHAFSSKDQPSFTKVALVEFPRTGVYSIGFLTRELSPEFAPNNHEKFYNVFIPTTPNPTTGYFIIMPENQIQTINISRQEAMSMIISGGIVQPERKQN